MNPSDSTIPVLTDRIPAARAGRFVPVADCPPSPDAAPLSPEPRLLESLRELVGTRERAPCCP